MARKCTVCSHPEHAKIDEGLARNASLREVAANFSLTLSALSRHYHAHFGPGLGRKSPAAASQSLLVERSQALYSLGLQILENPDRPENPMVLRTIHSLAELIKILKVLTPPKPPDIPLDPDATLRLFDDILQRYPEARAEIVDKIRQMRSQS